MTRNPNGSLTLGLVWLVSFIFFGVVLILFLRASDKNLSSGSYDQRLAKTLKEIREAQFLLSPAVRDERTYSED